ncbi:hypothetical protein CN179_27430, partial [Sinorhizobium medicae]
MVTVVIAVVVVILVVLQLFGLATGDSAQRSFSIPENRHRSGPAAIMRRLKTAPRRGCNSGRAT